MNLEQLRLYLLRKIGTTEEQPFGPPAHVYKVLGKMYALIAWQEQLLRITLKCDPDLAITLRNQYPAVDAGYHMNKKHWNSIDLDGSIPEDEILDFIDHSYQLVVKTLKKTERQKLETLVGEQK